MINTILDIIRLLNDGNIVPMQKDEDTKIDLYNEKNDQLLPAYNVQVGVADEYIAVVDVNQYRSDMDCFIPLMNKFYTTYGFYPKYPVADAGYGSYNNYIFCEQQRKYNSGKSYG